MDDFNLSNYCSSFLKDKSLGELVFYKEQNQNYTYRDLMLSVLSQAENNSDSYSALKIRSSYLLFIHLLAGSLTKKNLLIISDKEPQSAVSDYQNRLAFKNVIIDEEINQDSLLSFSDYSFDLHRPAFFILSSGSSGPSKSIGLSLSNVYHSAKSVIDFFIMTSADCTFLNLPHHHIGGLMILWRAFFSQSSVTKNEDDNYQFISLVPLQLKRALQDPLKLKKLQQCRGILIGGAPLIKELKTTARAQNLNLYETYGMSETSSLVMLNGIPLTGQMVKLDSENHFLIKGPTLSSQVSLDPDGFYHTKDIGVKNADGSFSFQQRSDVLFKSAGELIDPLLIEEKVKSLPWVKTAVVVPVAHPEWTWAATLIYQTTDLSKSAVDIKTHLKNELHPHHIPKYFFEAPKDLIADGMKPKRFEICKWAQEHYFKELIHHQYIPGLNAKKLMVFFHGFMEDHTDMMALMDNHTETSFLFIDVPGHGKTKTNHFINRDNVFSSLANLIQFYQIDRELIIYGYSMGGRIALELSAFYLKPQLLILESANFGLETNDLKTARLNADRQLLSAPDLDLKTFFIKWYQNPIFANYNQSPHFQREVEKKLTHNPGEWQQSLEFFSPGATPFVQSEILKKIMDLKIVGITGSDDHKYNGHYKEMRNNLPHFFVHEIPHAGHNPHKTHLPEIKMILKKLI